MTPTDYRTHPEPETRFETNYLQAEGTAMSEAMRIDASVEEALAAVRAGAWVQPERWEFEVDDDGRWVVIEHRERRESVHTRSRGGFGADWDVASALDFVAGSTAREWRNLVPGWVLVVTGPDGRTILFDSLSRQAVAS